MSSIEGRPCAPLQSVFALLAASRPPVQAQTVSAPPFTRLFSGHNAECFRLACLTASVTLNLDPDKHYEKQTAPARTKGQKFSMNPPSEQRPPRYIICHCRCGGKIEFDANLLGAEDSYVLCPDCGAILEFDPLNTEDRPPKISGPPATAEQRKENPPRYVTCHCKHCDGRIEFDANELVEENSIVPCPHCGLETKIFIPVAHPEKAPTEGASSVACPKAVRREGFFCGEDATQETKTSNGEILPGQTQPVLSPERIADLVFIGVPDAANLNDPNHPWRREHATPKQIAFLTYIGFPNADKLSKLEACELIDSNSLLNKANSQTERDRLFAYQNKWHRQRLILYPDAYAIELKQFLREDLPKTLHNYVRKQMVGASEVLTKGKIWQIMDALTAENPCWWHGSDYQAIFWERLRQTYPKCCDGTRLQPDK